MSKAPTAIELFCGCGGMSTGLLDAGIRTAAGFDIDRRSIEAYEYNHAYRGSRGFVANLTEMTGNLLLRSARLADVDLLVGGPPCQPFSIVGARRGGDDRRSDLIAEFLRLVKEMNPRAVLLENVPNLASVDGGKHINRFHAGLLDLGYGVRMEVVASADYGVPQVRRRLILLAIKGCSNIRFPGPTHASPMERHGSGLKPWITSSQVLSDLPPAGDFGECGVHNHEMTMHTPDMLARFATLRPGEREKRSFHDRLHPDKPSFTLRAGSGNFSPLRPIHYAYDRVITARESARLQGFADTFIWPDGIPRLQQYRQVGNAVPPQLAAAMARCIAEQLEWRLEPTECNGDHSKRANAITLSDLERQTMRQSRIRGASLGRGAELLRETASA
nr:DNA cytosine methyltransferase [uncultured Rhodopila sp.]